MLWLLLPAFGSMSLLAVTNQICQDVAVVPFLWILPLSLYLVTFIICFDAERWYLRTRHFGGHADGRFSDGRHARARTSPAGAQPVRDRRVTCPSSWTAWRWKPAPTWRPCF